MSAGPSKPRIVGEQRRALPEVPAPRDLVLRGAPGEERIVGAYLHAVVGGARTGRAMAKDTEGEPVRAAAAGELRLYLHEVAVRKLALHAHQGAAVPLEAMGLLLGDVRQQNGRPYALVADVLTARLDTTATSVRFDRRGFEELSADLERRKGEHLVVGWYHSHPGYGAFMSATDVETQRRLFSSAGNVGIVVDTVNFELKAFAVERERLLELPYAVVRGGSGPTLGWGAEDGLLRCPHCGLPAAAPSEAAEVACIQCRFRAPWAPPSAPAPRGGLLERAMAALPRPAAAAADDGEPAAPTAAPPSATAPSEATPRSMVPPPPPPPVPTRTAPSRPPPSTDSPPRHSRRVWTTPPSPPPAAPADNPRAAPPPVPPARMDERSTGAAPPPAPSRLPLPDPESPSAPPPPGLPPMPAAPPPKAATQADMAQAPPARITKHPRAPEEAAAGAPPAGLPPGLPEPAAAARRVYTCPKCRYRGPMDTNLLRDLLCPTCGFKGRPPKG